jgi:hypothetical protein
MGYLLEKIIEYGFSPIFNAQTPNFSKNTEGPLQEKNLILIRLMTIKLIKS